ncbi:MAG: helix-turn-helix domain-containing protein [Euzebya sp.]
MNTTTSPQPLDLAAGPMRRTGTDSAALTIDELLAALDGLPAFLSVTQAADVIGLSRSAAYRAVDRGDLPTIRLAGRLRVPIGALLTMMGLIEPAHGERTSWAEAVTAAAR